MIALMASITIFLATQRISRTLSRESLSILITGLKAGFIAALNDRIINVLTDVRITGYIALLMIALQTVMVRVLVATVITVYKDLLNISFSLEVIVCFTNTLTNKKVIIFDNTFDKFVSSAFGSKDKHCLISSLWHIFVILLSSALLLTNLAPIRR